MNTPDRSTEAVFEGRDLTITQQFVSKLLEKVAHKILALRESGTMQLEDKTEGVNDGKKNDLVTSADKLSERLIVEAIRAHYPDDSIRGEEKGSQGAEQSPWRWEIDPIDGTYNFIRNDECGISVGLLWNGEPVLGVIHFLHDHTQMYAAKGQGAFAYDCIGKKELPVTVEPGSSTEHLNHAHMAWDIGHGDLHEQMKTFTTLRPHTRYMTSPACYLVGTRQVLLNNRDAYLNTGAKAHDMAACIAIAREAGAVVSGIQEDIPDLTSDGPIPTIIARNKAILTAIQQVLRRG
jgi:myo-inositol-1(or 4)-monophosphatase